jgi:hypothetical protein
MKRLLKGTAIMAAGGVVSIAALGCGSSKKSSTASTATQTVATEPAAPTANPAKATSPSVTSGPVRATLRGANHTPVVGKLWPYTVHVTNATGAPLDGTVETDFVVPPLGVVGKESPPVHKLKNGALHDNITYPASAIGHPIIMVTVVRTRAGSVALAWPVSVSK